MSRMQRSMRPDESAGPSRSDEAVRRQARFKPQAYFRGGFLRDECGEQASPDRIHESLRMTDSWPPHSAATLAPDMRRARDDYTEPTGSQSSTPRCRPVRRSSSSRLTTSATNTTSPPRRPDSAATPPGEIMPPPLTTRVAPSGRTSAMKPSLKLETNSRPLENRRRASTAKPAYCSSGDVGSVSGARNRLKGYSTSLLTLAT